MLCGLGAMLPRRLSCHPCRRQRRPPPPEASLHSLTTSCQLVVPGHRSQRRPPHPRMSSALGATAGIRDDEGPGTGSKRWRQPWNRVPSTDATQRHYPGRGQPAVAAGRAPAARPEAWAGSPGARLRAARGPILGGSSRLPATSARRAARKGPALDQRHGKGAGVRVHEAVRPVGPAVARFVGTVAANYSSGISGSSPLPPRTARARRRSTPAGRRIFLRCFQPLLRPPACGTPFRPKDTPPPTTTTRRFGDSPHLPNALPARLSRRRTWRKTRRLWPHVRMGLPCSSSWTQRPRMPWPMPSVGGACCGGGCTRRTGTFPTRAFMAACERHGTGQGSHLRVSSNTATRARTTRHTPSSSAVWMPTATAAGAHQRLVWAGKMGRPSFPSRWSARQGKRMGGGRLRQTSTLSGSFSVCTQKSAVTKRRTAATPRSARARHARRTWANVVNSGLCRSRWA